MYELALVANKMADGIRFDHNEVYVEWSVNIMPSLWSDILTSNRYRFETDFDGKIYWKHDKRHWTNIVSDPCSYVNYFLLCLLHLPHLLRVLLGTNAIPSSGSTFTAGSSSAPTNNGSWITHDSAGSDSTRRRSLEPRECDPKCCSWQNPMCIDHWNHFSF